VCRKEIAVRDLDMKAVPVVDADGGLSGNSFAAHPRPVGARAWIGLPGAPPSQESGQGKRGQSENEKDIPDESSNIGVWHEGLDDRELEA
jgi:hypothetical protein